MYILGLSAFQHTPAAALLSENGFIAAIEEHKLARSHGGGDLPRQAIHFCLDRGGIGWKELDAVAVASRPLSAWGRETWLRTKLGLRDPLAGAYYAARAVGELGVALNSLRSLRLMKQDPRCRLLNLDHHLCHAASAFYASPFDRAAILTLDERGDGCCGTLAVGEGDRIRVLHSISFPHSLAWVYSQVTDLLGFVLRREEHKTQWLSLEGEPTFVGVFLEMFRRPQSPLPRLDFSFFNRGLSTRVAFSGTFYRRLGLASRKDLEEKKETLRRQLAASLQQACALVVTDLAKWLRRETGAKYLCLAGGLFLNVLLVAGLEKNAGFERVFVQPAAGDAGSALGAAWLAWHQMHGGPRLPPVQHLNWGPAYTSQEIKPVLDNCKVRYRWFNTEQEKLEETVRLLEQGNTVAWFQGAAEFGPRALGNRSLLASPWTPLVKENLNSYVKHRESFRPFAVAVPEQDCAKYFEDSLPARYIASLTSVRPAARELLKEFLLPGDSMRVQVVTREANPSFWRLLELFGQRNPAPILVNASFNLFGEPLVISPRDAVRSFFCSGIDAMVIDNFIVTKPWEVKLVVDSPNSTSGPPATGGQQGAGT